MIHTVQIVVAMARNNEDIYLKNKLDDLCSKLNAGILCNKVEHDLKKASIIRGVNSFIEGIRESTTLCEIINVYESPSIICLDQNQSIDPEYNFIVTTQ